MEVCPLSRGVILHVCSTPIPSITEEPSLFPHSCTHTSISFPCGSLSRYRERYGLPMFRFMPKWVRSIPFRREPLCSRQENEDLLYRLRSLWASLSASLACWPSRRLSGCAPLLSVPLNPSRLSALMLAVPSSSHDARWQPFGCGYVVPEASHRLITLAACPGRILLVKQQVSSRLSSLRQTLERLHVAPS